MIVIPVKEGENVERALKRFKRKFEKTGVIKELRSRQAFEKPSVIRRAEIKKAIYIQSLQREMISGVFVRNFIPALLLLQTHNDGSSG